MRRLVSLSVTIATLLIISNIGRAQTFTPPKLSFAEREQATKKDPIQVITRETPEVITKETPAQAFTKGHHEGDAGAGIHEGETGGRHQANVGSDHQTGPACR